MKEETLEEACLNYSTDMLGSFYEEVERAFAKGAKWQMERSYSEEDLRKAYMVGKHGGINQTYYDFDEWFEQFKKK